MTYTIDNTLNHLYRTTTQYFLHEKCVYQSLCVEIELKEIFLFN